MSILVRLERDRKADRERAMCRSETELIAEYDAMRQAYIAALASNNVEGAVLWARRANSIIREIVQMQEQSAA